LRNTIAVHGQASDAYVIVLFGQLESVDD